MTNRFLSVEEAPVPFILLAVCLGSLLATAIAVAGKLVSIFGLTPAATVIPYALTFLCTDAISELYGKKRANQVVLAGVVALLLVMVLILVAVHMPPAPFWKNQEAFEIAMGSTVRVTLGSMVAYIISQFHDVWAFHFWRRVTDGRHLWLRNNASTITSQALDTVIFITIAFAGVFPIWQVIVGQFLVKVGIAALDTPIVYLLVGIIRRRATGGKS